MKRSCIIISLVICCCVPTSVMHASAQSDNFDLKLKGIELFEKGPITHDTQFLLNWLRCSIIQDIRNELRGVAKKPILAQSEYNAAIPKTRTSYALRTQIRIAKASGAPINQDQQNASSSAIKEACEAVLAFKRSNDALIAQKGGRYCQNLYCWQTNPCINESCKK